MTAARTCAGQPVIIGAGLAGLMVALALAPEPVVVICKNRLGAEAASGLAQGGIAASLGEDDSAALHAADTIAVGGGLCDASIVDRIVVRAPDSIAQLIGFGVAFDRQPDGTLALGLEAAHSRRRIVHAGGDRTGAAILSALVAAVRRTPSITVLEGLEARRIAVQDHGVAGVLAVGHSQVLTIPTGRVVIATGGIGGLFAETTNPSGSWGQGLVLAARAGAHLADIEFVQFHPTALDIGRAPMPLVSEAVRGEGATLIDETGARFMRAEMGQELAARDVVARAVWRRLAEGHRVFLDARGTLGTRFAQCFPYIAAACAEAGIDPATQPIPIRPAAHYHMGGIAVDAEGKSSVPGLWACGECAATGLHGANRLASNSLLEAAVCAPWVAASVRAATSAATGRVVPMTVPPDADAAAVRPLASRALGVLRDAPSLQTAIDVLLPLVRSGTSASDPALVALMIAVAAWRREESRGAHYRDDFPRAIGGTGRRAVPSLQNALHTARKLTGWTSSWLRSA